MGSSYQAKSPQQPDYVSPTSDDLAAFPPQSNKPQPPQGPRPFTGDPRNPYGENQQTPVQGTPVPQKDGQNNPPAKDGSPNPPKKTYTNDTSRFQGGNKAGK